MDAMARESKWEINRGGVALMWRGGCIIRSAFLGKIKEAFDRDPKLTNLLLDPYFQSEVERCQTGWRQRRRRRDHSRHPRAGDERGHGLLRWLPLRSAPRQPSSGPARLLRRPYLRTRRSASRPVLPHQLDRPRWLDLIVDLQRLKKSERCDLLHVVQPWRGCLVGSSWIFPPSKPSVDAESLRPRTD